MGGFPSVGADPLCFTISVITQRHVDIISKIQFLFSTKNAFGPIQLNLFPLLSFQSSNHTRDNSKMIHF